MEFLSNGFHQLYSELDDDLVIWNYTTSGTEWNNNDNGITTTYELNNDIYSSNNTCDYYSFVDNRETLELTNILTNDCGKTFEPFQSDYENSLDYAPTNHLPGSDWENEFLENYIEIPDLTDLLPERTPLCNDSCNLFLKESSDNLSKFRPDRKHRADNNIFQKPSANIVITSTTTISSTELGQTASIMVKTSTDLDSEKIFPCTFGTCSKVYAKPAHLKAHIRRHLGDKPYVCTWPNCTWKFSRSDELARHRRSHSGVKPYKCTYCTKCFARSDHLAKHRKVHERKMAASKLKGIILANLQNVRPGRKPKEMRN